MYGTRDRYVLVPVVKIQPGLLLHYTILDPPPSRKKTLQDLGARKSTARKMYTGLLSVSAKKKLIRAINLLVAISLPKKAIHFQSGKEFSFRVNFVTLTLPAPQADVTDKQLKEKCLKRWIEFWKDKRPGFAYVWRAERQGNGNLHFHLITNQYIHFKEIRESWNKTLSQFHFIDDFQKRYRHRCPNSTDVHAVRQIRNLGAYIAKYMSKGEGTAQPIEGKVWDCSSNLSSKDRCDFVPNNRELDVITALFRIQDLQHFETDHCIGVKMNESEMHRYLPLPWKKRYSEYLARVRG
jgi:hypothetical protein